MADISGQWPRIARHFLEQIGPPLRPSAEDVRYFQLSLPSCNNEDGNYRALILGVTPELYNLKWPNLAEVYGIDRTPEMIDYVWPGMRQQVFQMNWLQLGEIDKKFDVILCDGGWHLLSFPAQQIQLASLISNSLKPGGRFIVRLFVPSARKETVAEVLKALINGQIPSLNHLKISLGTAMQQSPADGVRLGDVWNKFQQTIPNRQSFAERVNWDRNLLQAIDAYELSEARYHFVELNQVVDLFKTQDMPLDVFAVHYPKYIMGEQFPLLVLERKVSQS